MTRYVLVLLLLAGCASQITYWQRDTPYTVQDFQADDASCRAQAFSVPGAMQNLMQVAIVQNQCLQAKGWYKVKQ